MRKFAYGYIIQDISPFVNEKMKISIFDINFSFLKGFFLAKNSKKSRL